MAHWIVQALTRNANLFETPRQQVIFQCLAGYTDQKGLAWPSYKTMARQCNCDYRTVQRAFAFFRLKGYIHIKRRWNNSSIIQITRKFFALLHQAQIKAKEAVAWARRRFGIRSSKPKDHPPSWPAPQAAATPQRVEPQLYPGAGTHLVAWPPGVQAARERARQLIQEMKAEIAAKDAARRSRSYP